MEDEVAEEGAAAGVDDIIDDTIGDTADETADITADLENESKVISEETAGLTSDEIPEVEAFPTEEQEKGIEDIVNDTNSGGGVAEEGAEDGTKDATEDAVEAEATWKRGLKFCFKTANTLSTIYFAYCLCNVVHTGIVKIYDAIEEKDLAEADTKQKLKNKNAMKAMLNLGNFVQKEWKQLQLNIANAKQAGKFGSPFDFGGMPFPKGSWFLDSIKVPLVAFSATVGKGGCLVSAVSKNKNRTLSDLTKAIATQEQTCCEAGATLITALEKAQSNPNIVTVMKLADITLPISTIQDLIAVIKK